MKKGWNRQFVFFGWIWGTCRPPFSEKIYKIVLQSTKLYLTVSLVIGIVRLYINHLCIHQIKLGLGLKIIFATETKVSSFWSSVWLSFATFHPSFVPCSKGFGWWQDWTIVLLPDLATTQFSQITPTPILSVGSKMFIEFEKELNTRKPNMI